jgi:hypothetical protein
MWRKDVDSIARAASHHSRLLCRSAQRASRAAGEGSGPIAAGLIVAWLVYRVLAR